MRHIGISICKRLGIGLDKFNLLISQRPFVRNCCSSKIILFEGSESSFKVPLLLLLSKSKSYFSVPNAHMLIYGS